jgi:hypothetical protein
VAERAGTSLAAGQELVAALRAGWRPTPQRPPFHLRPDEVCYSMHEARVAQLLEGDPAYLKKSTFGIGVVPFAMMAANAVGNSARRHRAAREAEARFRPIDAGPLYLTSKRLAVQGLQWIDIWYDDIRRSYCDESAVTLEMSGSTPLQLRTWPAYWVFAMLRFVAYGEIVELG